MKAGKNRQWIRLMCLAGVSLAAMSAYAEESTQQTITGSGSAHSVSSVSGNNGPRNLLNSPYLEKRKSAARPKPLPLLPTETPVDLPQAGNTLKAPAGTLPSLPLDWGDKPIPTALSPVSAATLPPAAAQPVTSQPVVQPKTQPPVPELPPLVTGPDIKTMPKYRLVPLGPSPKAAEPAPAPSTLQAHTPEPAAAPVAAQPPAAVPVAPLPVPVTPVPAAVPEKKVEEKKVETAQPKSAEPKPAPQAPADVRMEQKAEVPGPIDVRTLPPLSEESKRILSKLPSNIGTEKPAPAPAPVNIERGSDTEDLFEDLSARTHEAQGIKIEIKKPDPNIDIELEKAYDALVAGQMDDAIIIYKQVLAIEPDNRLALLGLGTTYHRLGKLSEARTYYGKLLAIDPTNPEALGNFFALISEESPHEALTKLKELETKNPNFSPIPAQIAVIQEKLGNTDQAIAAMKKAILLSPENLTYRYNLAIMLDRNKRYAEAKTLYQMLISAHEEGRPLPASIQQIQERLTFISSNRIER